MRRLRIQNHPVPPPCRHPAQSPWGSRTCEYRAWLQHRLSLHTSATSTIPPHAASPPLRETQGRIPHMMAGHRTGREGDMRALERGVEVRALTEVGTVVVGISDAPHEEHAVQSRAPVSLLLMTRDTPRIRIQTARTARSSTGALRCCPLSHLDDGVVVLGVAALLSRCRRNQQLPRQIHWRRAEGQKL